MYFSIKMIIYSKCLKVTKKMKNKYIMTKDKEKMIKIKRKADTMRMKAYNKFLIINKTDVVKLFHNKWQGDSSKEVN